MENSGQASWAISELNGKILEVVTNVCSFRVLKCSQKGCSGPVIVRYADSPDEKQVVPSFDHLLIDFFDRCPCLLRTREKTI